MEDESFCLLYRGEKVEVALRLKANCASDFRVSSSSSLRKISLNEVLLYSDWYCSREKMDPKTAMKGRK